MASTKIPPHGLIRLILESCEQKHMLPPLKTRLVKLMYLVELEYFRRKRTRLTDLDWKFYLYGPYPPSVSTLIGSPDVDILAQDIRDRIAPAAGLLLAASDRSLLNGLVKDVVGEWGNADLNQLLDYVYFETEPMQSAKRGDYLDFSTVRSELPKKVRIDLDQERLRELRKKIADRAPAYRGMRKACTAPKDLVEGLKVWDDENDQLFPTGSCSVHVADLRDDE